MEFVDVALPINNNTVTVLGYFLLVLVRLTLLTELENDNTSYETRAIVMELMPLFGSPICSQDEPWYSHLYCMYIMF